MTTKPEHYVERIDEIFGYQFWKHRSLRTIFNPTSHEWTETKMNEKVEYLKKILESGENLEHLLCEYKITYINMNKEHVALDVEYGLQLLLEYMLIKK